MIKSEISPRTDYALREKSAPDAPLQRVRIIEHILGNKWKAEWVDPNPGLIDYVESGHLICRWKDHKAFLREEAEATVFHAPSILTFSMIETFKFATGTISPNS